MRSNFLQLVPIHPTRWVALSRSITCDLSRAFRKNSTKEGDLSEDDVRTIRASLCGLVKYYISKGMSQEEMHSILGYVAAIGDEDQVRGSAGVDPYP